jgi:Rieske Fe-S protein
MGDTDRRPGEGPAFDPHATPMPRRRMLVLMGVGTVAVSGGLGAILAGCAGPPVTVTLDVNPADLEVGVPVEVPFTLVEGDTSTPASTWLVKKSSGELISYDPRCTHANCRYAWDQGGFRFRCACHDGQFALDGAVLAGPPPRPLYRWPNRVVGDTVEIDVPGDFETPKASLPS